MAGAEQHGAKRLSLQRGIPDTARLFFALWPDEGARAALAGLAESLHQECGGRLMLEGNIHLTLAFLGNIPSGRIAQLHALAAAVAAPCFDLKIDTLTYWRHNRIVWAGTQVCPSALRDLVAQLARALRTAGFRCEEREYAPHITLLRDARRAPATRAVDGIAWRAGEFTLVQSLRRNGAVVYEAVGRWPLSAAV